MAGLSSRPRPQHRAACAAAGVVALALFLYLTIDLLGFPYGVQYEEGVVLDATGRIVEAEGIYTDFSAGAEPRYVLDRYGPFYPYLTAYLYLMCGFGYFGGRVVALFSTLGSAVLLTCVLRRCGAGAFGLLAAAFFLASRSVISFGALHRPEPLGLFWGLLSLALALRGDRLRYAAPVPAVLALVTTPLGLAGLVAAAAALFARSRRDGAFFTGTVAGVGALCLIAAEIATGGLFKQHALLCGGFSYWCDDLWDRFGSVMVLRYLPGTALAAWGLAGAVRTGAWAPAAFGVTAVCAGLRAGYETEDSGVLVEAVAGLAVLVGMGLARIPNAGRLRQPLIGLGLAQGVLLAATAGHEFFPLALRSAMLRRDAAVMGLIAPAEGYVLSDDPCYPALLKKGLFLEPRTYRALVRQARVDERDLLRRIRGGDFPRAVLRYDLVDRGRGRTVPSLNPNRLSLAAEKTIRDCLRIHQTFDIELSPAHRLITEVRAAVPMGMPR